MVLEQCQPVTQVNDLMCRIECLPAEALAQAGAPRRNTNYQIMDINELLIRKRKELLIEGILLTLLGLVFLPVSFAIFNAIYFTLGISVFLYIVKIDVFNWQNWYIAGGIFILMLIIDTIIYPEEQWVKVKFILASAFKTESGPVMDEEEIISKTVGINISLPNKGILFAGMPYMTNMGDPINWANQIKRLANFGVNLTLACPRKLKEALSYYLLYFRLNQDMLLRLNEFVNRLQQRDGECILSKCPSPDLQIIPLAIELKIVSVFKKIDSEDYGIRLSI